LTKEVDGSFDVLDVDIDDSIIGLGNKGVVVASFLTVDSTGQAVSVGRKRLPPSVTMEGFKLREADNSCLKTVAKCVIDGFEVSAIGVNGCAR